MPTESRRVRLVVGYDGSAFHGFALSQGVPTVAGELMCQLAEIFDAPVELTCAGRTDGGVHARAQVVSFDLPAAVPLDWLVGGPADPPDAPGVPTPPGIAAVHAVLGKLRYRLNALLPDTLRVIQADVVSPDFDARFSATARTYRYFVWNHPVANPLRRATTWHVRQPLHLPSMRVASDAVVGSHDFSSFCRQQPPMPDGSPRTMQRRIHRAEWHRCEDGSLYFEVQARAFCHQMVRSLTGSLVDIGRGRRRASQMRAILEARDRQVAGPVAPPHGLVLWHVTYPSG